MAYVSFRPILIVSGPGDWPPATSRDEPGDRLHDSWSRPGCKADVCTLRVRWRSAGIMTRRLYGSVTPTRRRCERCLEAIDLSRDDWRHHRSTDHVTCDGRAANAFTQMTTNRSVLRSDIRAPVTAHKGCRESRQSKPFTTLLLPITMINITSFNSHTSAIVKRLIDKKCKRNMQHYKAYFLSLAVNM